MFQGRGDEAAVLNSGDAIAAAVSQDANEANHKRLRECRWDEVLVCERFDV